MTFNSCQRGESMGILEHFYKDQQFIHVFSIYMYCSLTSRDAFTFLIGPWKHYFMLFGRICDNFYLSLISNPFDFICTITWDRLPVCLLESTSLITLLILTWFEKQLLHRLFWIRPQEIKKIHLPPLNGIVFKFVWK